MKYTIPQLRSLDQRTMSACNAGTGASSSTADCVVGDGDFNGNCTVGRGATSACNAGVYTGYCGLGSGEGSYCGAGGNDS